MATVYWWVDGLTGNPNSLNNTANWSATQNGPGGFGVPPMNYDTQINFSSGATNDLIINSDVKYYNLRTTTGYSGTITINGNSEIYIFVSQGGNFVFNGDLTITGKSIFVFNTVQSIIINGNLILPGVPYAGPGDVVFFDMNAQTAIYNGNWIFADPGTRVDVEQNVNRTVSGNLIVNGGTVYFASNSNTTFNSSRQPAPQLAEGSTILNPERATYNYIYRPVVSKASKMM